jgi:hypothetical protein
LEQKRKLLKLVNINDCRKAPHSCSVKELKDVIQSRGMHMPDNANKDCLLKTVVDLYHAESLSPLPPTLQDVSGQSLHTSLLLRRIIDPSIPIDPQAVVDDEKFKSISGPEEDDLNKIKESLKSLNIDIEEAKQRIFKYRSNNYHQISRAERQATTRLTAGVGIQTKGNIAPDSTFCFFARVPASMRAAIYTASLLIENERVVSQSCQCVASASSDCSHVAVLYSLWMLWQKIQRRTLSVNGAK